MRIERLEQNKIKVTLSGSELAAMNIDAEMLMGDSSEIKEFLINIMEIIKEKTGFSAQNAKTVIEAIPKENGAVLLVSRLAKASGTPLCNIRAVKKTVRAIFEFEQLEDVYELLLMIDSEFFSDMRLYKCGKRYYIIAEKGNEIRIITEFAERIRVLPIIEANLSEYGELIADGAALVQIADYAKKYK